MDRGDTDTSTDVDTDGGRGYRTPSVDGREGDTSPDSSPLDLGNLDGRCSAKLARAMRRPGGIPIALPGGVVGNMVILPLDDGRKRPLEQGVSVGAGDGARDDARPMAPTKRRRLRKNEARISRADGTIGGVDVNDAEYGFFVMQSFGDAVALQELKEWVAMRRRADEEQARLGRTGDGDAGMPGLVRVLHMISDSRGSKHVYTRKGRLAMARGYALYEERVLAHLPTQASEKDAKAAARQDLESAMEMAGVSLTQVGGGATDTARMLSDKWSKWHLVVRHLGEGGLALMPVGSVRDSHFTRMKSGKISGMLAMVAQRRPHVWRWASDLEALGLLEPTPLSPLPPYRVLCEGWDELPQCPEAGPSPFGRAPADPHVGVHVDAGVGGGAGGVCTRPRR